MPRLTTIDLGFQGFSQVIAAFVAPTGDGRFVLFESGPASSVEAAERGVADLGFAIEDLAAIFATASEQPAVSASSNGNGHAANGSPWRLFGRYRRLARS